MKSLENEIMMKSCYFLILDVQHVDCIDYIPKTNFKRKTKSIFEQFLLFEPLLIQTIFSILLRPE